MIRGFDASRCCIFSWETCAKTSITLWVYLISSHKSVLYIPHDGMSANIGAFGWQNLLYPIRSRFLCDRHFGKDVCRHWSHKLHIVVHCFINTQYCRSYIVLIVNALMVISLYCRTFGVTPMWSKVVKLKVSHRALIFVLRHCFQWISGKLPPWNTRNNIYVVAVVVFQTHVPRLFAWDVSYISNIFIELLPPPDGVLRQQPMPYTL